MWWMTFDDVLREHGPALWRVIASYAPPGAERDDLAQDVLVAVWQSLQRFRGDSLVRPFVLRIAHNRGLSHAWRRASAAPAKPCADRSRRRKPHDRRRVELV